jgi:serine/threonine-protein kinase
MSNGGYPQTSRRLPPGTRLNGIYEIDQQIGAGGMGEIYRGHAIQTGDPIAIKMMLPELAENEAALALFRKEASALHYLQHEAIVRYYVFTVEPQLQRPYLAMEFVDGRSLSDILQSGPLTFEAARSLMQRLAVGLQAAHERGIIHRDVSPDNVLIPGGDVARAKIIDFGIARSTNLGQGTVIGSGFAGKHNYVSPEQLGLFGGNVTAKSDIYSLGLVLVEALTGRPIDMGGSQFDIVEKRRKVPDLGAIDMRFRPLLEKMLQPDPDRRPESMAAVANWPLNPPGRFSRRTEPPKPKDPAEVFAPGRSRGRWRYAAAAVLLLLAMGGGGGYYYYSMLTPVAPPMPPMPRLPGPGDGDKPAVPPTTPPPTVRVPPPAPSPPAPPARPTSPPDTPSQAPPSPTGNPPIAAPIPAPAPGGPARIEKIRRYVEEYDGGECFFVAPVAVGESAAALEGFGASIRGFESLDRAFAREHGFEASIGLRQVTQPQCPAITFLARLRAERARAPRLQIASTAVRSGDVLNGTIENFGVRHVELLLVSDTGQVQNVSYALKDGIDAKTFSLGMQRTEGAAGQPQLLLAVASPRLLEALRPSRPVPADQFFLLAQSEAARAGLTLSATARYFKLER